MAVGIVRRIDELGRIVIPKEMRKTMRLQVGDEMEISANDEGLTLKRYTGFQSVLPSLKALAKALASATGKDVLILSASEVVLCEGNNKKRFVGARLTGDFSDLIRKRNRESVSGDFSKAFENVDGQGYILCEPVVSGGDFFGCVALVSEVEIADEQKTYLNFCAEMISATLCE